MSPRDHPSSSVLSGLLRCPSALVALAGVAALGTAEPARAQFSVTPVVLAVAPADDPEGDPATSLVRVRNEGDRELTLRVYARDFAQDSLGDHAFLAPGAHPRGCGDRVRFSPDAFSLPPGGAQAVSIRLAPDAGAETCWSLVFVESPASSGDGLLVGARIGVKVFGLAGEPSRAATVRHAEVLERGGGRLLRLDLRNDGDWPIQTRGAVEILAFDGSLVGTAEIESVSVLPQHRRRIDVPLALSLEPGRYVAVSIIDLGDEELIGAQVTFRVEGD